jgi:proteasome lid subunit RPN8/RPN11
MTEVNKAGHSYGFRNGIHWAERAVKLNEIEQELFMKFKKCSEMFVKMHGISEEDFSVSEVLINVADEFLNTISQSKLRNQEKMEPKLPKGTFRAYTKEFHWKGIDGEPYNFRFSIYNEGNEDRPDYRIDIEEAPHFDESQNDPHRFHILGANTSEPYICWDSRIKAFDKANAVMIVWAQNYKKELDSDKERNGFSSMEFKAKSKKKYLPKGTFRTNSQKSVKKNIEKRRTIYIEKQVLNQILDILGKRKPELGGILGFTEEQDLITSFVFDKDARVNSVEYNPNTEFLDTVINDKWTKDNISLAGFVHSHPGNFNRLSSADIEYAVRICKEFDLKYLFMPIVTSSTDSEASITGYIVTEENKIIDCDIETMDNSVGKERCDVDVSEDLLNTTKAELDSMNHRSKTDLDPLSQDETFARISTTVPLDYMKDCTIVGVGCGGARGFYEDMVRCGIGRIILIDGDISSRSNIASQNGYISEIGKNKARVVMNRLLDINDNLTVIAIDRMLDDSLSDEDFERYLTIINAIPEKTIICAFTDCFEAQARCQRLSIKLGIPFLAAQHHANGDSSEVIYWYPGISRYSQEEILTDRYDAYENGFKNDVTSVGSPIFNTTRLNALCEKLALGILLYKANCKSRYSSFLWYNPDRNLLLVRQKCLEFLDSPIENLFGHRDRDYFDDVVWLNPEEIL